MKHFKKDRVMRKSMFLSIAVIGVLVVGLATSDVSSAGTMGFLGHTPVPADASCFGEFFGSVQNTCAGIKRWQVTDTVNAGGNHSILVTAFRPNGGTVTCQACSATKEGFNNGCGASTPLNVVDADTQFSVGTVNVPAFGGIVVFCDLSQFAWYDSVNGF
jgi:hypothetical protein